MTTYYHGGPEGRQRGAFLLPPAVTKADTLANHGAEGVCRRDRVYLTTNYAAALLYAAGHKRGVVYEVEPIGDMTLDPDCNQPGLSFECERARVRRIIKPTAQQLGFARSALLAEGGGS